MKTHIKGSNNRTFCGNKINDKTKLLVDGEEDYMSDCNRCLDRLMDNYNYLRYCFKNLREIKLKEKNK